MMPHVFAVDDDTEVLQTLGRVLRLDNLEVTLSSSGVEAIQRLDKMAQIPDLLILDIMMPEMDGIAVCEKLRSNPRFNGLPILFVTAKGTTDDIVRGLDAGADDYIVKPFQIAELRARIQALLRRAVRQKETSNTVLEMGDLRLDSNTYQAYIRGEPIQLTSTEHRLLRYLLEHVNQVVSLSQLLQDVWDYPSDAGDPDLVRAHVRNLRTKIEQDEELKFIRTIHGVGYMAVGK